jgi:hypothetical protein
VPSTPGSHRPIDAGSTTPGERNGADRRPFHHEPEDRGAGGQAFPQAQEGDSLPLRLVPHYRANANKFIAEMKGHATAVVVPEKGKPVSA